jgi:hypothetical protein
MATRNSKTLEQAVADLLVPKTRAEKEKKLAADFNAYIETYYNQTGELPSMERLKLDFPEKTARALTEDFKAAAVKLETKGYGITKKDYLTPEQLAVANSILNLADKRSITKKLQDFSVSPAKYANWKKNPIFNGYLRERSEALLGDSVSDVHLALIDSASSGDIQAIKLFYEITGRHTQHSQQNVNVQVMLTGVIEAVAKYVKDPEVLQKIAGEIQEASQGVLSGNVIKGELA